MSDTGTTEIRETRSRRRVVVAVALVVLVVAAATVWYFFIRGDAPDAFDIDDATSSLEDTGAESEAGSGDPGTTDDADEEAESGAPEGVDGSWAVAPGSGSEAGFRVDEELASIGAATAVGRTENVSGRLTIDGTTVTDVTVDVDLASLRTDESRRDGRMRDALGVDEFPTATFVLTEPIELDELPAEGETITVTATGDLTIKGVTNAVDVTLDARLVDDTLVVVGSSPVVFSDHGIEAPTAPVVVSVDDNGTIEFQLFFTRA